MMYLAKETFAPRTMFRPPIGGLVIGFTGPAGSGKSFAADVLVSEYGFKKEKLAGPLKDMMRAVGLTERHIEGDLKEVPCDMLAGRTPRHAMQTLGTEWGRGLIGEDMWTRLWLHRAARHTRVVCDDVRFQNEADAVRSLGGIIVYVDRDQARKIDASHESERFDIKYQARIINKGDERFKHDLAEFMWSLSEGYSG